MIHIHVMQIFLHSSTIIRDSIFRVKRSFKSIFARNASYLKNADLPFCGGGFECLRNAFFSLEKSCFLCIGFFYFNSRVCKNYSYDECDNVNVVVYENCVVE